MSLCFSDILPSVRQDSFVFPISVAALLGSRFMFRLVSVTAACGFHLPTFSFEFPLVSIPLSYHPVWFPPPQFCICQAARCLLLHFLDRRIVQQNVAENRLCCWHLKARPKADTESYCEDGAVSCVLQGASWNQRLAALQRERDHLQAGNGSVPRKKLLLFNASTWLPGLELLFRRNLHMIQHSCSHSWRWN